MDEAVDNGNVVLYDSFDSNQYPIQRPETTNETLGTATATDSDKDSSNTQTPGRLTSPDSSTSNYGNTFQSKQNQQMLGENTVKIASTNRDLNTEQNFNGTPYSQPRDLKLNTSTPTRRKSDVEPDAKPETPYPQNDINNGQSPPNFGIKQSPQSPEKSEQMHNFENNVLRPKNQFDQRMTADILIDVVIVYAKSDYDLAQKYIDWLKEVARRNQLHDIEIYLYTSEAFPSNNVKVVEDIINRAMRVLMLLSDNFSNEVNLNFIKEEAIGLTRLQELPQHEQISLFATTILNRKKNCVRPVHTASKRNRFYRTPVGLSALRAFEFSDDNPNLAFEYDMAKAFLKKAREDREYHSKELQRNQSFNNPCVFQVSRDDKHETYSLNGQRRLDNTDTSFDYKHKQIDFNNSQKNIQSHNRDHLISPQEEGNQSIASHKLQTSDDSQKRLLPREVVNPESSEIVGPSMQQMEVEKQNKKGTKSVQTIQSNITSGYGSSESFVNVLIGKVDSLNEKQQPNRTANRNLQSIQDVKSCSEKHFETDGLSSLNRGDEEEDSSIDHDKSEMCGLDDPDHKSLMLDSLMTEQKDKHDTLAKKNKGNHFNQGEYIKSKHKSPYYDDDVKQHNISYSEPSGRSGIQTQTQARPEFGEYMAGVPNGSRLGAQHVVDDDTMDGYREFTQGITPNNRPVSFQPQHQPQATGPSTVHYHYHYPPGDVDADEGSFSHGQSTYRRPTTLPRDRVEPPPSTTQPSVRAGPVFNIQGCGSVQIGDGTTVVGNQNLRGPNTISNDRNSSRTSDSIDSESARSEDEDTLEEPPQNYDSDPQQSQNNLSPGFNPEKKKESWNVSSEESSSSDNENFKRTESIDERFQSEEMFGGKDNDMSMNLSSCFQDKAKTKKSGLDDEMFIVKEESSEQLTIRDKSSDIIVERQATYSATIRESPSGDSLCSSLEFNEWTTCLTRKRRQDGPCFNQQIRCEAPCTPVNCDDDID